MVTTKVKAYGATGSVFNQLKELEIERRAPTADEVQLDVLYCGVCHSDLHQVRNDWHNTVYPCIPGHEIVGRVTQVGAAVRHYQVGDLVGVGCMIDSCGTCSSCREGVENYCEGPVGFTATYNGYMKPDGSGYNTFGGYSTSLTVKEAFVLRIPAALDPAAAAPILCAGVTTYSPLKHWGVKPGDRVGVAGLGGLGHMAVQIAAAMGAHVTVITEHEKKRAAAQELGAQEVLISSDAQAMADQELTLDFILVTIPDAFDVNPYLKLLKRDGVLVTVGLLAPYKAATNNMEVAMHRRSLGGSLIGSVAETQEVLDFCAQHHIQPETRLIRMQDINKAFDRMLDSEIRFRYVIDMATLSTAA